MKNPFKTEAKVWLYPGPAPWHFVTIGKKLSSEIDKKFGIFKRGWGSLPVSVKIGKSEWRTSIFPDKKSGSYLLAIKAEIRKKENIKIGDNVLIEFEIGK
jgi:hypothetical protein